MTPSPPPTTVCFDLGGVVVRICRSWEEGCRAAGVRFIPDSPFLTPEARAARAAIRDRYQCGAMPCEDFFRAIAATAPGTYTPEEVRAVHDAWVIGDYPGIGGLVDELNQRDGLATACLSNTNASHWAAMLGEPGATRRTSHAVPRLRHRLASHILRAAKPDREIYRLAESHLGARAGSLLFFDDLPENVEAARAAGWRAELIDPAVDDTAHQLRAHLRNHGVL